MPTPQQVLPPLLAKLARQQSHAKVFGGYYSGEHRLEIIEREYAETFGLLPQAKDLLALRPPDTHVAAVGTDALSERLQIETFRDVQGVQSAPGGPTNPPTSPPTRDTQAEDRARQLWEECDLDVQHRVGHTESLIKGRSFLLLTEGRTAGKDVVSVEDATQMAVLYSHEPPYDVVAGVKTYTDPWTGAAIGKLWVLREPDLRIPRWRVERYTMTQANSGVLWTPAAARTGLVAGWMLSEPETLPFDEVPIGEVAYRTRLMDEPRSYIEPIASLADNYALLMAYLTIAARYGAIPVRWMAGVQLPRDSSGNVRPYGWNPERPNDPPRRAGAGNALASEDPAAKYGQLEAGQLAGFIAAIDSILSSIVAINRVPQHYYGRGASSGISGETLKTSEVGLDRRTNDVTSYYGQPYRKVMSMGVSHELGRPVRVAPQWADTRTRIDAQLADALQKYVASGLDLQSSLELLTFPPELIRQALARKTQEQAQAAMILDAVGAQAGVGGASTGLRTAEESSAEAEAA